MRALIKHKADVNVTVGLPPPLFIAAELDNMGMMVALIGAGANVERSLGIAQHNGRARAVAKIREAQARHADTCS